MLISVWSPKGGVGTSTIAVALAATVTECHRDVRLIDLGGDAPAIVGVRVPDHLGIGDLLRAAPATPTTALDAISVDIGERFSYVGPGRVDRAAGCEPPAAEAGLSVSQFVNAVRSHAAICVVDCQTVGTALERALVANSDLALIVVQPCFVLLQRTTQLQSLVAASSGVVYLEDQGRSLTAADVGGILGRPLLAKIQRSHEVARTIDAGVLLRRRPAALFAPIERLAAQLGLLDGEPRRDHRKRSA